MLGEPKFSLYLRGVGVNDWDEPLIIGEREMYSRTDGVYLFSILTIY
jgi:hypothetical protein